MSGGNLEPHDHVPELRRGGSYVYVRHGDTQRDVSKAGPFLQWRIRRALRVTKRRHDRGTAKERGVQATIASVTREVADAIVDRSR